MPTPRLEARPPVLAGVQTRAITGGSCEIRLSIPPTPELQVGNSRNERARAVTRHSSPSISAEEEGWRPHSGPSLPGPQSRPGKVVCEGRARLAASGGCLTSGEKDGGVEKCLPRSELVFGRTRANRKSILK